MVLIQLASDATVFDRNNTRQPPCRFSSKLEFARGLRYCSLRLLSITYRCNKCTNGHTSTLSDTGGTPVVQIQEL